MTSTSQRIGSTRLAGASDLCFYGVLGLLSSVYIVLIVAMVLADLAHTAPSELLAPIISSPEIRASIVLSLVTCTLTTVLSLWVAIPIGYLMARHEFRGKTLLDAILDIPIVLPPLVVGLSLLILFGFKPFSYLAPSVVFEVPGVVLAQFMVACAFAVRTLRVTFEQISPRQEDVALTLGCSRARAFWSVVIPQARGGILTAATIAWARSMGEFGPILIFAGSTRRKTEVLPTTVFLEFQAGHLREALAVSLIMILAAMAVLVVARWSGLRRAGL